MSLAKNKWPCKEKGLNAKIEYGEAAFYGPKLDFMVRDAIGRKWQLGTIQVDYNLPERFNLEYTGEDNKKHRPVMGRDAGFLAINGAIASGAEAAIIPEVSTEVDQLEEFIKNGFRKSKNSSIVLVAESELTGGAMHYAERVKKEYPQYEVRVTILGHVQRGGSPTAHVLQRVDEVF